LYPIVLANSISKRSIQKPSQQPLDSDDAVA
jgi:hypothetical protein